MNKKLLFLSMVISSLFVIVGCFLIFAPAHVDKENDVLIKLVGMLSVLFFGGLIRFSTKKISER